MATDRDESLVAGTGGNVIRPDPPVWTEDPQFNSDIPPTSSSATLDLHHLPPSLASLDTSGPRDPAMSKHAEDEDKKKEHAREEEYSAASARLCEDDDGTPVVPGWAAR